MAGGPPAESFWPLAQLVFVRFGRRKCELCDAPHCWQLILFGQQRHACWDHLLDVITLTGNSVVPAFTPARG